MTKKITSFKVIRALSALCFVVYFSSYLTRINYGAIIAEIVQAEGILKSSAAIVTTASFISYGVGQLFSGFIGDKVNPRKMIFAGLAASSVLNVLMMLVGSIQAMTVVWLFNGFAQAMIWPPMVRLLSGYLSRDTFQRVCVTIMISCSLGTIAVYLLSPVCILLSGWRAVFVIAGGVGLAVSFIWLWGTGKVERHAEEFGEDIGPAEPEKPAGSVRRATGVSIRSLIIPSGLLFIILGILMQGILRDGVTTWMPSYILETFHLGSSVSILSAVALPIFSIFVVKGTAYMQRRFFPNELLCAAFLFCVGCAASVAMAFSFSFNMLVSIVLAAIITGCMHGVNLILICLVPGRFESTGKVAYVSGLLNFFTYVGSALSMYGVAKLSESIGWQFTIACWAGIALLGTLVCSLCVRRWKKFCKGSVSVTP